jgi:serine/threonine protein kinase
MLEPDTLVYNRYRIIRHIGQGGMGAVYEAFDQSLSNRVALKQTFVGDTQGNRAFEHEAQLLARLRHLALPKVIDHFVDGAEQFLVMEFIPGEDLGALLDERGAPFPVEAVLEWADQLLNVLEYLHTQLPPVIHRDIKPQNL